MKTIGYAEALALLNRAVAERGEGFIYHDTAGTRAGSGASCRYFHGQRPGCIVGHVLSYLDVTAIDMTDSHEIAGMAVSNNFNEATGIASPLLIKHLREHKQIEFTDKALALLGNAQNNQDTGMEWGTAVVEAEAYVGSGLGLSNE